MDGAVRWRRRQDLPSRQAAGEHAAVGVLQRGAPGQRRQLAATRAGAADVSEMISIEPPSTFRREFAMQRAHKVPSTIAAFVFSITACAMGFFLPASVAAQASSRGPVIYLDQAWSQADREWYYQFSQGSTVISYDIFLNLEVAGGAGALPLGREQRALRPHRAARESLQQPRRSADRPRQDGGHEAADGGRARRRLHRPHLRRLPQRPASTIRASVSASTAASATRSI